MEIINNSKLNISSREVCEVSESVEIIAVSSVQQIVGFKVNIDMLPVEEVLKMHPKMEQKISIGWRKVV